MHIGLFFGDRLPVKRYGGTQRVVVWLARGLAELGHRVTLLAGRGTRVPEATVVELDLKTARRPGFDLGALLPDDLDILHAHAPLRAEPPSRVPSVWTFHGNSGPGRTFPPNTIGLSADHARRHGLRSYVHNGLDPAEYTFAAAKGKHDLFLGRLASAKGWRLAIEGARRSGHPLVVAGGWRPTLRPGLHFAGPVDQARKAELLAEARCLWMPAQWDEPFGLTLIEALVSGTPVLGTRRGALPEVITPEVGALGQTLEELVALRPGLEALDAEACRARVVRSFTHVTMAQEYVRLYRGYLHGGELPPGRSAAERLGG